MQQFPFQFRNGFAGFVRAIRSTPSIRLCATAALISATLVAAACSGTTTDAGTLNRGAGGSNASAKNGASNAGGGQAGAGNPGANGFIVGSSGAPAKTSGSAPSTSMTSMNMGTCASGMQSATPVTPTVWLVVDGSSSMSSMFEGQSSRWLALRQTLMAPGGVVDSLQSSVRFGMVIYAGGDSSSNCVQLVTVDPELNNLSKLSAQYPMNPVAQGTPTDKALEYVVNNLPVLNTGTLDATSGPVYVVLATDGQPNDNCGGGGRQSGATVEQRVVDVTEEGTRNGMQMYVISMAGGDTRLQTHLGMVAAATASKTPPYAPSTQGDLIAAFRKVIGGASCLVSLDGKVEQGKECAGSVRLNTQPLQCNKPDGWMLFDPSTVQLTGAACDMFMAQTAMVVASFPCEVFSPN